MRLPVDTHLGELRVRDIYEYYDGPRLFSCESSVGQVFVALSVEDLREETRWLYCPVSALRLASLEQQNFDLRSVFTHPESNFVFEVRLGKGPDQVTEILASELPENYLPFEDLFVELEPPEERVAVPVAPTHANQTRRETLRLALSPRGIEGFEAPSRLVGQVLVAVQEVVSAIGQAVASEATTRGRIQPDILTATELRTVGTFAGSFGVELAAAQLSDMFGGSPLADSLQALDDLISAGDSEARLGPILERLKPRSASKYQQLIALLADSGTGITFDWGSVDRSRGAYHRVSADTLSQIAATLKLVDTTDVTTYSVTGVLIGLNTRTRSFEIEDRVEQRRVRGKLDRGRFASDDEFTINGVYRGTIEETVEVSGLTGDETVRRLLVELVSTDTPRLSTNKNQ